MEDENFDSTESHEDENVFDNETETTNLEDEMNGEEVESKPPEEENEARQLNIGNVFAAIIVAVVVIIGLILILGKPKKKKVSEDELSKAGTKYIPDMKIKEDRKLEEEVFVVEEEEAKSVDEILETLPPSFKAQPEPEPAPVAPLSSSGSGSSSGSRRTRPDTSNSKSIRRVEGIAGQNYEAQSVNNKNIVSAIMNGNGYSGQQYSNGYSDMPSKEEYIQKLMSQSAAMAGANGYSNGYGNPSIPQTQQQQNNREAFFNNNSGGAGTGQYLSYGSLWEGTIISAVLETAINTDNPGVVIARVTENVYSSYDHSFLLIPEGTLLYATYNSSVSYGQNKVQVAWNLMIRPDGYKVQLGNMHGVNAKGASGYRGFVNTHPFQTLKALGLVAIYSLIQTEMNEEVKDTNNQYLQNAMTDTYSEVSKLGAKIVDRALDIKPTIMIKSGREVKLITNTTLELPPVQVFPVTRKYVRTR